MLRRLNLAAPQVREINTPLCGTQAFFVDQYIASAISRLYPACCALPETSPEYGISID